MNAATPKSFFSPHRTLSVDGIAVAYRRSGQGDPLLYLHGAGMVGRWLPLYEALASGHDVVVPEHPGFGATPLPDWFRSADLVPHYRRVLDSMELDRVHLVGHSLGGWIAANLASQAPERVLSLSLITPAGLDTSAAGTDDVAEAPSAAEAIAALFNDRPDGFEAYFDEGSREATEAQLAGEDAVLAHLSDGFRFDSTLPARLAYIAAPTLVVAPDEDRIIPADVFERFAELIPNARLMTLSGTQHPTGHAVIAQEPERLAAVIADFVAESSR